MTILNFKDFMKKTLKNDTMDEIDLQSVFNYKMYPGGIIITKNEGFINIDNGSKGGTHWTCFIIKNNKSFYFDSFGVQLDNVLLTQLPKPII